MRSLTMLLLLISVVSATAAVASTEMLIPNQDSAWQAFKDNLINDAATFIDYSGLQAFMDNLRNDPTLTVIYNAMGATLIMGSVMAGILIYIVSWG